MHHPITFSVTDTREWILTSWRIDACHYSTVLFSELHNNNGTEEGLSCWAVLRALCGGKVCFLYTSLVLGMVFVRAQARSEARISAQNNIWEKSSPTVNSRSDKRGATWRVAWSKTFLNRFSSLALRECFISFSHFIWGAGQERAEGLRWEPQDEESTFIFN